jgi:hypothetical protein
MPRDGRDYEEITFTPRGVRGDMGGNAIILQEMMEVPLGLTGRETVGHIAVDKNLYE